MLLIAYVIGRLVVGLVTGLLEGVGFDRLPAGLRLAGIAPGPRSVANTSAPGPSNSGHLVLVAIKLFASVEAANSMIACMTP